MRPATSSLVIEICIELRLRLVSSAKVHSLKKMEAVNCERACFAKHWVGNVLQG
jgi:hypothetical protein